MDAQRFDEIARVLSRGFSRRGVLRAVLGACAAGVLFRVSEARAEAQNSNISIGDPCTESFECRSVGGHPVCEANGSAGGTVCCHNQGGSCGVDHHCCGDLGCDGGVCGGGGLGIGSACREQNECAPIAPGDGWAACAKVGTVHDPRCCLVSGSWCSFDWECCGTETCQGPGICGGAGMQGLPAGAYCSEVGSCNFRFVDACEGNGVVEDGPTNCCRYEGGYCDADAQCCGVVGCIDSVCGGEIRDDVPPGPRQNAATAAMWLSRHEVEGNFDTLYDWLHPDAQAVIPRAAVVGWYENDFAPRGPGMIEVTSAVLWSWIWQVTGQSYYGALVGFRQPFADGTVIEDQMHLVKDEEGRWRWFFGRDRAFVDEQIRRFATSVTRGTGVQPQEPCTSTEDCSQVGGSSRCVRGLGGDGFMVIVCLRDTGGTCGSDDDCLRTMTCNGGICGSLLAGQRRTTMEALNLRAGPPESDLPQPGDQRYPADDVPLLVIPAGSVVTLTADGSVFGYIGVEYNGVNGWVLEEHLVPTTSSGSSAPVLGIPSDGMSLVSLA